MATTSAPVMESQVQTSQEILADLVEGHAEPDFAIRFWDGTVWQPQPGLSPRFTIVLKHPGAVRNMFWPPRPLTMAQAFLYDDFDIEGDMVAFTNLCRHLSKLDERKALFGRLSLGWRIWRLPQIERPQVGRRPVQLAGEVHSKERDKAAISYHYDTSNEFFLKALGPTMVYTSAMWENDNEDLETAQRRKLDVMFQKLQLKPGDRLLDIGCGWGTPIIHAASQYGANCLGVTISAEQAKWGTERIREAGVAERCKVEVRDYRDMNAPGQFDKIVMMEVGEHFGADQFEGYFQKCFELLRPGGRLLIQQITLFGHRGSPAAREFSQHYVFPDGELVPVSLLVRDAEKAGFDVADVESIRAHYPRTLTHWLANLEANRETLVKLKDEATYRTFRLYFAGAKLGFLNNTYNLHHLLAIKPEGQNKMLSLTRRGGYTTDETTGRTV